MIWYLELLMSLIWYYMILCRSDWICCGVVVIWISRITEFNIVWYKSIFADITESDMIWCYLIFGHNTASIMIWYDLIFVDTTESDMIWYDSTVYLPIILNWKLLMLGSNTESDVIRFNIWTVYAVRLLLILLNLIWYDTSQYLDTAEADMIQFVIWRHHDMIWYLVIILILIW